MSTSPLLMVTFAPKASMTFRLSSEAIVGHCLYIAVDLRHFEAL